MIIKGLLDEDMINYKKISMFIQFPKCSFKCDIDAGCKVCQNSALVKAQNIDMSEEKIVSRYITNPLTHAIVIGGLEPFDSPEDLISLVSCFRRSLDDDIVIYSGYTESELYNNQTFQRLKSYKNIVVKFGRFIPNDTSRFDEVLGVTLASSNQYATRI